MEKLEHFKEVIASLDDIIDKMSKASNNVQISGYERDLAKIYKELEYSLPMISMDLYSLGQKRRKELADK